MQNILLALIGGLLTVQLFETMDKNGHPGGDVFIAVISAILAGAVIYGIAYSAHTFFPGLTL